MQLLWCDSADEFSRTAADKVLEALARKPDLTVALPTGRTPLGLYAQLRARAATGQASFDRARWFDLDEYVGLDSQHPLSYARFIRTQLLAEIGVSDDHVRLLRGDASDPESECRDYDRAIAAAGGLDLAILGLGANGHIAFNEPGSDWHRTTHVTELTEQTRVANSRGLSDGESVIPRFGMTMGIGTLREARRILLLVSGEEKRAALQVLRTGTRDRNWPVTSLLRHPELTVIADSGLRSPGS